MMFYGFIVSGFIWIPFIPETESNELQCEWYLYFEERLERFAFLMTKMEHTHWIYIRKSTSHLYDSRARFMPTPNLTYHFLWFNLAEKVIAYCKANLSILRPHSCSIELTVQDFVLCHVPISSSIVGVINIVIWSFCKLNKLIIALFLVIKLSFP